MKSLSRRARWWTSTALVAVGLLTGAAQGGGVGGWGHGSLGDDDIGSMPDVVLPDAPSLLLFGTPAALDAVLLDVQGPGDVLVRPLPGSNRVVMELEGTLTVQLDARLLANGQVWTLFGVGTTFADGKASYYSDGTWSGKISLHMLAVGELPLELLADPDSAFAVHAQAQSGERFTLWSRSADQIVSVGQVLRDGPRPAR